MNKWHKCICVSVNQCVVLYRYIILCDSIAYGYFRKWQNVWYGDEWEWDERKWVIYKGER